MSLPAFALIVSMNHAIGDGHTYYRVYDMLGDPTEVRALDPVRADGFKRAAVDVFGEPETTMLGSASIKEGVGQTHVWGKLTRRPVPEVCLHTVDSRWVAAEKAGARQEGLVPFVSTNDVITSWFLRETGSTLNLMAVNLRGRRLAGLELPDSLAGNYGVDVPYSLEDVTDCDAHPAVPAGFGRQLPSASCGRPPTPIPSSWELLQNRTSFITSWAGFYRDVLLPTDDSAPEAECQRPQLHLPIMAPDEFGISDMHIGIVFSPREGEVALMTMSRVFGCAGQPEQKRLHGPEVPLGLPLI